MHGPIHFQKRNSDMLHSFGVPAIESTTPERERSHWAEHVAAPAKVPSMLRTA